MPPQHTSYALLIETGAHAGMVIPVTGELFTIGRELDNSLVLDSPRLSRYHARLRISPAGTVLLEDLNSTNGTFVNGYSISGTRRLMLNEAFTLAGTIRLRLIEMTKTESPLDPAQWTVTVREPAHLSRAGSTAAPLESETWIAPALASTLPPNAIQAPSASRRHRPIGLYLLIGFLLLTIVSVLALSIYLWFAPPQVWQQIMTLLKVPIPPP